MSIKSQSGDPANFVINAELPEEGPHLFEELWARQLGEDKFELCCIPFFLYDIALGDIVQTVAKGDRKYVADRVITRSGHCSFRVWFGRSVHSRDDIASQLIKMGALVEWSSPNLLAADAPDVHHAKAFADFLAERERRGELMYETGRTS